jgi:hypothetical protein
MLRKQYFSLAAWSMLALIPVSAIGQTAAAGAEGAKFGGA